jgi:RNA polymerase sigma factor (TIGR02999 family)
MDNASHACSQNMAIEQRSIPYHAAAAGPLLLDSTFVWQRQCTMPLPTPERITQLLRLWRDGDVGAGDQLVPLVYEELRRIAQGRLRRERPGHTLRPTALVHDAWLRLSRQNRLDWQNRAHFFALASQAMRRVLVDHARRREAQRRGADPVHVSMDAAMEISMPDEQLVELDDALVRLERMDARQARIVEMRFFCGLSVEETARELKISAATVKREWATARAWLYNELEARDGKS